MEMTKIRSLSGGANQSGLRDYNERLLLSMLLRNGPMPKSDLARHASLSPQTVSVILRKLENDGLLERREPQRGGRVGKPSVPMALSPRGVLSFGFKLGRRSAELMLIGFTGSIISQRTIHYARPIPSKIFQFLGSGIDELTNNLTTNERSRICGLGLAAPLELSRPDQNHVHLYEDFDQWGEIALAQEVGHVSRLPVHLANDATAACKAEHVYGRGKEFRDYAYFFVASYIGGGVVLNHSVFEGHQGNAGALGSLRSIGPNGESRQLIDIASLHLLEKRLEQVDLDPNILWQNPNDWSSISRYVDQWIGQTAQELAKAALSTCSVIDFEAIIIDGSFPSNVRDELVERTQRYLANQDKRGLIPPAIEAGTIGCNARAIGAASGPIFSQFFLNTNVGLSQI